MPGPNKRISKVKIYADTKGDHRLSADGSECYIGGSKFRRTILPSVAKPKADDVQLNDQIETIDEFQVKETGD